MCTYNIAIDDRDSIELPSNKIWESKGFVERERERERESRRNSVLEAMDSTTFGKHT